MTTSTFSEATRSTVPGNGLTLAIGKFRETTQELGSLRSLVFNEKLMHRSGTSWSSPKFGTLNMESLTEGEDITNFQTLSSSNVVITPGEAGLAVKISKKSEAQWSESMAARTGRIMKDSHDRKIDADIGALGPSFTTYTLGTAGAVLTPGILAAGKSRLKGGGNVASSAIAAGTVSNQAPAGRVIGAFRWESLTQVMRSLIGGPTTGTVVTTSVGASGGAGSKQDAALENLYVDRVAGVHLYGNSNLAKDASDDTVGIIFHSDAIAYIPFPHDGAEAAVFVRDSDDGRSFQMSLVTDYGLGILDQNYGIAVTVDATAPTA